MRCEFSYQGAFVLQKQSRVKEALQAPSQSQPTWSHDVESTCVKNFLSFRAKHPRASSRAPLSCSIPGSDVGRNIDQHSGL